MAVSEVSQIVKSGFSAPLRTRLERGWGGQLPVTWKNGETDLCAAGSTGR